MEAKHENPGYRIWAPDSVVYGPVGLAVLEAWAREQRVKPDTWIHREADNTWQPAASLPELQACLGRTATAGGSLAGGVARPSGAKIGVKPESLRRVKIFAGMSDEQLLRFVDFMEIQRVGQWEEIVRQGSPGDAMFFLLEGEARVRLMIDGKESILVTLAPGDFFGEISLFDHGPRSADVVANRDSVLLKVAASAFQRMLAQAPELAAPFLFAVGKTMTGRIRADNKRYHDSIHFARSLKGA